jgi:proline iminopeptidase
VIDEHPIISLPDSILRNSDSDQYDNHLTVLFIPDLELKLYNYPMDTRYPLTEPYHTGRLQVSTLHNLYYEECGNPQGQPAVFLHGGPGGGIRPESRRYFDPNFYRAILFDQRGAGKSTPYADIRENDTWNLVEDLERLRTHLGIERWVVFGGSWGSTLALCYAMAHPDRVSALLLRGVYLGRRWENQWLFQEGASYIYPDRYQNYIAPIPVEERGDLIHAYYRRLTDPDPEVHLPAAVAWSEWEGGMVHHLPQQESEPEEPLAKLSIARMECHYMVNDMFFPQDNYILDHAAGIAHIPCRIVHGRYDVICPARIAWDLVQVMPQAQLTYVADGSHAATDPSMACEIVRALEDFKKLF